MPEPTLEIGNSTDTGFAKINFRDSSGALQNVQMSSNDQTLEIGAKEVYTQDVNQKRGTANFVVEDEIIITFSTAFKTPPKVTLQTDGNETEQPSFTKSKTQLTISFTTAQTCSVDWIAVQ